MLTVAGGADDPRGGTQAWRLTNAGAGSQAITQTLSAPAGYLYCLSAYARTPLEITAAMLIGGERADRAVWLLSELREYPEPKRWMLEPHSH